MGFSERQYGQAYQKPSQFDGAPMTKALIILNVVVFVIDYFFLNSANQRIPPLQQLGAFLLNVDKSLGEPWRFVTYQFFHANLFHLLGNMVGLYFFGPMVERWWGSRPYLAFYLICGCLGAQVYVAASFAGILSPGGWLIGASGSLFGVLIAAARIAPNTRVMLLFPPIPMKLRTMAICFLGYAIFITLINGTNAGGEACHLGGAIAGFILMRFPKSLAFLNNVHLEQKRDTSSKSRRPYKPGTPPKLRPRPNTPEVDREIDEILEKVHAEGIQSLTDREKQVLKNASKR